jgi:hypothetical protein
MRRTQKAPSCIGSQLAVALESPRALASWQLEESMSKHVEWYSSSSSSRSHASFGDASAGEVDEACVDGMDSVRRCVTRLSCVQLLLRDEDDEGVAAVEEVVNACEAARGYSSVLNKNAVGSGHARSMLDSVLSTK